MTLLRIGDLARRGGVSVRMLRHYHDVGLLVPETVDDATGYRLYDASQVPVLRRIVTLKNLGLTLIQVAELLSPDVNDERVRRVLAGRRADIVTQLAELQVSLDQIDLHLTQPPRETTMDTPTPDAATSIDVELKALPARLVAQVSAVAESWAPEHIGPVIQPLYPDLTAKLEQAGVPITGPSTAWYSDTDDGSVMVHATLTIDEPLSCSAGASGFEVIELPAIDQAAVAVHRGTFDDVEATGQALLKWVDDNGYQPVGYHREMDIECGPDNQWTVELQQQIEPNC